MTPTAKHRKYAGMKIKRGKGTMIRRAEILPPTLEKVDDCPFCNKPVFASPGQLLTKYHGRYTHKACRKKK